MAISFKSLINRIKETFPPSQFMNVETGEVFSRRSYNKLTKEEQEQFVNIKRTPLQTDDYVAKTNFNRSAEESKPGTTKSFRRKTLADTKSKTTTTKSIMPSKPPAKVVKDLEKRMSQPTITVNNIDELKKRLEELERKAYPFFDVEAPKAMLLSIVENAEAYYENEIETYYQYLTENEETIAGLITDIEYRASTQDEFNNAVTNLATILNMQPLSTYESEELAETLERNSYGV